MKKQLFPKEFWSIVSNAQNIGTLLAFWSSLFWCKNFKLKL